MKESALHSDKIPLIIEKHPKSSHLGDLPRCKYLFLPHFKVFAITDIIR